MAFNSYVTLDGKKYKTLQRSWQEMPSVPKTGRLLLSGDVDVTFAANPIMEWEGELAAAVSPATGYGSPADLYTTLEKTTALSFTDHRGTAYSNCYVEATKMRSLLPDWEDTNNIIYIFVKILAKGS